VAEKIIFTMNPKQLVGQFFAIYFWSETVTAFTTRAEHSPILRIEFQCRHLLSCKYRRSIIEQISVHVNNWVVRWYIFKPKIPIWVNIG
jgi:hypothetical protein